MKLIVFAASMILSGCPSERAAAPSVYEMSTDRVSLGMVRYENREVVCYDRPSGLQCKWKENK